MPHADSSLVPESIKTKAEFWEHVYNQVDVLLVGQRNWVTNLANTSSVIFNSLRAFPLYFGSDDTKAVNWCGFYIASHLFPVPSGANAADHGVRDSRLLLGPFCGKPACQFIITDPTNAKGVCADAFLQHQTLVVRAVDLYPGHIACDSETKSEIVCPLILREKGTETTIGVLDLDCLAVGGFGEEDKVGLEKISELIVDACDW